jgi:DHA1 family tetracycline resistance protein-like MFS transporter
MTQRKPALRFIFLTLFLDVLGMGVVVPILPKLLAGFVGNDDAVASRYYGYFVAVYALMQFVCSPILGSLSDRAGRRPVLITSLFGQGLDYLLLGFAPSLTWLFVGRVISGITGASIGTAAAYIADVSKPEDRAKNFGIIGMAFGLGFIAGPLLGGVLGGVDLRLPFFVSAGLTLVNAAYGYFVLPESLAPEHRRPFSLANANPVSTLWSLAKNPVVLGLAGTIFCLNLAQRGLETTWVLYTTHRYGWTVRGTGLSLAVVGLSAAIVQGGIARRLIPSLGERKAVLLGISIGMVSFALYGLAPQGWMLFVILPFNALGGISGPAVSGLLSRSVSPSEQGKLQGGLTSLQSVTAVLGPLLATNLFSYFISPGAPLYLPGASYFSGAFILLVGLLLAVRTFSQPSAEPKEVKLS